MDGTPLYSTPNELCLQCINGTERQWGVSLLTEMSAFMVAPSKVNYLRRFWRSRSFCLSPSRTSCMRYNADVYCQVHRVLVTHCTCMRIQLYDEFSHGTAVHTQKERSAVAKFYFQRNINYFKTRWADFELG